MSFRGKSHDRSPNREVTLESFAKSVRPRRWHNESYSLEDRPLSPLVKKTGLSLFLWTFLYMFSGPAMSFSYQDQDHSSANKVPAENADWETVDLFDGKSLAGWKVTQFGGQADVGVRDGAIAMEMGDPLTGVTVDRKDLPHIDYEVTIEARRVAGDDFFCCLTFPVDDSHCSLVVGGWAGTIVGLSSIDQRDAARNDTKRIMSFENGTWYKIKVRVVSGNITCWIDDEEVVNANIAGKKLSVRNEVRLSEPLGICSFQSTAEIRKVQITKLEKKLP